MLLGVQLTLLVFSFSLLLLEKLFPMSVTARQRKKELFKQSDRRMKMSKKITTAPVFAIYREYLIDATQARRQVHKMANYPVIIWTGYVP